MSGADPLALVRQLQPALERNDRATLNRIVAQLVAIRAAGGLPWDQLALIAAGNGELTLARQALDRMVEAANGAAAAQFQKAALLATLGLQREADDLLNSLPETVPDPLTNTYCRGTSALGLGKPGEARARFDGVVRDRPQSGLAWFGIAMATDFSGEPALADRLIAAERKLGNIGTPERAPFYYALGKVHADRGEHALAFQAFERGAGLTKSMLAYDRNADRMEANQAIDGYGADRIAAIAARKTAPSSRTIFVMGLPRSGTTLVEQILTSHSRVTDGGEIARLRLLAGEVGGAAYGPLIRYVTARGTTEPVQLWDHWLDELYPGAGRIVDKTPDMSRFLGLAAALLPEAPLIWMTRDPLDRAWSCFRTNFQGGAMPWSYDLRDIAAHFRLEDQLLARWQAMLDDRLLVLSYEALVEDPATWIRRILAHCGLGEEPQVFAPQENRRPVATASMLQVRRPINRDGIGAAEPYRQFLAPFLEAYAG